MHEIGGQLSQTFASQILYHIRYEGVLCVNDIHHLVVLYVKHCEIWLCVSDVEVRNFEPIFYYRLYDGFQFVNNIRHPVVLYGPGRCEIRPYV